MRTNPYAVRAAVAAVVLAAAVTVTVATPASAAPSLLSTGSAGTSVSDLQRQLNSELGTAYQLETDGQFGPLTKAAVTWFQTCTGLEMDGVVGPKTRAALDANAGRRVDDICLRPAD
ncbi:peptidoglycan-binding domain-containing protein [Kitasatospora cineracea]|uniref:peptidoglycan-binding domain-containing protein n=1 Tax=Kitasatospora cineracea TaxID=88074 RepID=UPI0036CD9FC4